MKYLKKFNESLDTETNWSWNNPGKENIKEVPKFDKQEIKELALSGNIEEIKKLLDNGLDVNFETGLLFRFAIVGTWKNANNKGEPNMELIKFLVDSGFDLSGRIGTYILRWSVEYYRKDVVEYILSVNNNLIEEIPSAIKWVEHVVPDRLTTEDKADMVQFLEEKLK